jgi:hypothetical protein
MNNNLLQVSESLSESSQIADRQREKYEKQIVKKSSIGIIFLSIFIFQTALERELESRTKRHEMQLAALTENLAAVRSELKINQEKLALIDQIKAEKTGWFIRSISYFSFMIYSLFIRYGNTVSCQSR